MRNERTKTHRCDGIPDFIDRPDAPPADFVCDQPATLRFGPKWFCAGCATVKGKKKPRGEQQDIIPFDTDLVGRCGLGEAAAQGTVARRLTRRIRAILARATKH